MKKNNYLWIVGLLLPLVGLILIFTVFRKNKDAKSNLLVGVIVGFCLSAFALLAFSQRYSPYIVRSVDEWYKDVSSGNTVVTVFGASYCSHCKEYKPVLFKIAKKYDLNLYYFQVDTMDQNDFNKLTTSFEIKDYTGSVPFTFVMKKGEYVGYDVGFQDEETTIEFFKNQGLIKN